MAIIGTGNHPKDLWPGVMDWFGADYNEHPMEYPMMFDVESSDKNFEEEVEQSSFGLAPIKPEGSATAYDSHQQGFTKRYVHVAYSLGYIVTREEMDDGQYLKVSKNRSKSLAFSMRQTRENVGANIYNRAFNTSYTGGDGKALLVNDHPTLGADQSNILSTAAALGEGAIEDLAIDIMDALNSRGLKISLMPTKLIVPTAEVFEATRVLKSTLQNDTANNATNALRSMGTIPEVALCHYLTDANNWFIRTNVQNGLTWLDRKQTEFQKDNDFDTDNAKAKAYMRFSAGWTDWRSIYGSEVA